MDGKGGKVSIRKGKAGVERQVRDMRVRFSETRQCWHGQE